MQATARIFIQKAPAKRTINNLCPVKLAVTHNRQRKYYSIADKLKNNDWLFISEDNISKVITNSPRGKYRDIKFEYDRITREAGEIINNIPVFSFGQFEDRFYNKAESWDNVFTALISHIEELKDENRFSYASTFESTLRSVIEFQRKKKLNISCRVKVENRYKDYLSAGKKLTFYDITPVWLKRFEKYLREEGKSRSTIGIYMRNLRVLFNLAIKEHGIKAEYPFSKYKPGTSTGNKRALPASDISKIANYKTEHPQEIFYRDIFMFSFLANGMNTADIARLRYSNIEDDELSFVRQKTKEKQNEESIRVPITQTMKSIIDRHGNKFIGHDAYIFPILKPGMNERAIYYLIKQFTKMVNKYVGNISESLGIGRITSYTARHSWATISKNSGTSSEYIKEALGHSNVSITEKYLKSFEASTRREHSERIEQQITKPA